MDDGLRMVQSRLEFLYERFPPSKYVWAIYYSGGKDSTCLLFNVKLFAEKMGFTPTVIHNGTGVEIPMLTRLLKETLHTIRGWGFRVKVFTPEKGFFNLMLERGYSFPVWYKRWCCRTLKYGLTRGWERSRDVLALLGLRGDEYRRLKDKGFIFRDRYRWTALPLIDVDEEWVWRFLKEFCPWNRELRSLYPKAWAPGVGHLLWASAPSALARGRSP